VLALAACHNMYKHTFIVHVNFTPSTIFLTKEVIAFTKQYFLSKYDVVKNKGSTKGEAECRS
jgi:hypothetical protein